MNFALCSLVLGSEYKEKMKLCTQSQDDYVKKNGYSMIRDESVYHKERAHSWSKIPLVQKYLGEYDYLMWIDADVMVMNDERRIEDFIKLIPDDKFLFIGRDLNGLNAGVFIIKNCKESFTFLEKVWSKTEYLHHIWWEQAAIIDLYNSEYKDKIYVLPHKYISIFNAYDYRIDSKVHWKPGDFCIHFAGIHHPDILRQLQIMYSQLKSNDSSGTQRIENYTEEFLKITRSPLQHLSDSSESRLNR